jgi:hypothetical protein
MNNLASLSSDPPPCPPPGLSRTLLHLVPLPAQRSLVTTFFLLALFTYGEDIRTIAKLSIDDYLYPDAEVYNVFEPLELPHPPMTSLVVDGVEDQIWQDSVISDISDQVRYFHWI